MWRKHFGRHYPAMGLFGVTELFEPEAQVELMGVAVLPGLTDRPRGVAPFSARGHPLRAAA